VKDEGDELSWAAEQFQSKLGSIRREHERALGERDEAHQECIIARKEQDAIVDQMKEATCAASRLAEKNLQLKLEVQSL
jgi:uncharacterized protein (DUF3084 family)